MSRIDDWGHSNSASVFFFFQYYFKFTFHLIIIIFFNDFTTDYSVNKIQLYVLQKTMSFKDSLKIH